MSVLLRRRHLQANTRILDNYPALSGWSLELINSSYTGDAIRVRRSSDNTEQDIGFNADGTLDESSLTSFVGANDGFIRTWYDQIGTNDVESPETARQPKIVSAGTVITASNGLPAGEWDGAGDRLRKGSLTNQYLSGDSFLTAVVQPTNSNYAGVVFSEQNEADSDDRIVLTIDTRNTGFIHSNYKPDDTKANFTLNYSSQQSAALHLASYEKSGSSVKGYRDTTLVDSDTTTIGYPASITSVIQIGRQVLGDVSHEGYIQEVILWNTDESSNRSDIQNNIINRYSI